MMSSDLKDFKMTQEELDRIEGAFKDEGFRELFADYMKEISDPKNKALYEEEITKLEKQRGNDVSFLHPDPGFVAKTKILKNESSAVPVDISKAFVNICSHKEISKPEMSSNVRSELGAVKGQNWRIPYSMSKARIDKDNAGASCCIIDAIFHPDAIAKAHANPRFAELLVSTALDGIKTNMQLYLDINAWKRIKASYKGTPSSLYINKSNKAEAPLAPPSLDDLIGKLGKIEELGADYKPSKKAADVRENALVEPKHTIAYATPSELLDMSMKRDDAEGVVLNRKPTGINVRIELPKVAAASEATLDITEATLSLSVPEKYKLDLTLPVAVQPENGSARFDKTKRILTIELPVQQISAKLC